MGSLSPVEKQGLEVVWDQRVLNAVAPLSTVPVLSKIAKLLFTACTYWVGPTSPTVSGGSTFWPLPRPPPQAAPWEARQRPSKFTVGAGAGALPACVCTTGSGAITGGCVEPTGSLSTGRGVLGSEVESGSELTGSETPLNVPVTRSEER